MEAVDSTIVQQALEATTIDLCLSLFPWPKFRKHKAAVKTDGSGGPRLARLSGNEQSRPASS